MFYYSVDTKVSCMHLLAVAVYLHSHLLSIYTVFSTLKCFVCIFFVLTSHVFPKINRQCAIFVVFFRKRRKVKNRKQKQKETVQNMTKAEYIFKLPISTLQYLSDKSRKQKKCFSFGCTRTNFQRHPSKKTLK